MIVEPSGALRNLRDDISYRSAIGPLSNAVSPYYEVVNGAQL